MDGQVDQVYECKNQSCERQYNIVNGKPQKLVRTIASGPDEIIEMYEDKNGKLELIKKTTRPALRVEFAIGDFANTATEGGITTCGPECYEKNFRAFDAMLTEFEAAQKVKPPSLRKVDDFYVSRVGVLIHEECFERYGPQIEQWVTDATVQGMTCQFDSYNYSVSKNRQSMAYESHIPRLMNLFNYSQRINEGAVVDINGQPKIMTNPCQDYKSLPLAKDMQVNADCRYVPEVELGMPKVICQSDQFATAVSIYDKSGHLANAGSNGYASGPHSKMPSFVNWKGKTKVYNYPVIGFVRSNAPLNEETFKAKFWHEIMHNCGYSHSDEGPDRAYFCEVACFGKAYNFDDMTIQGAGDQCESSGKNSSTHSELEDIKRRIISLSPSSIQ